MQLTVRDVARLLEVSEKTVYRWAQKAQIPFYRVNDQYRFNRVELLEWATAKRISVSPGIFAEPSDEDLPTVSEALEGGGIHYRIPGGDVGSVLREVVRVMRLPDEVNRDHLLQVLLAREALGSTGFGGGVAIPHVRNPIVLHVPRPTVTLCFLEQRVDFHALDGLPVQIVFTLVSPTVRAHLHLLSRLAFCLRDAPLQSLLAAPAGRDVILEAFREIEAELPTPAQEASA